MRLLRKSLLCTLTFICFLLALHFKTAPPSDRMEPGCIYHSVLDRALYFGAGASLGACALSSKIAWAFLYDSSLNKDFKTFSDLCAFASFSCLKHMIEDSPSWVRASNGKWIPFSHKSWYENHEMLSKIPCVGEKGGELLSFLEKRWLAKANGFFPLEINYISPCFGFQIQVSPETRNSYARDPFSQPSQVYENRIAAWKQKLPHPESYPLLLMRSDSFEKYLPSYSNVMDSLRKDKKNILDLTNAFSTSWEDYRPLLIKKCNEQNIDLESLICIECIKEKEGSGIRILPWNDDCIEEDHNFLLGWISSFGITANPIELDRIGTSSFERRVSSMPPKVDLNPLKEEIQNTRSIEHSVERKIMVEGFLKNFEALLSRIEESTCPTKTSIVRNSLSNIQKELHKIRQPNLSFLELTSHIEQAHLNLLPLLEIASPFSFDDFSNAYARIINPPTALKPLTSYGLLASGMSALAGVFKAVELPNHPTHTIYGKNTYFECMHAASKVSKALSESEASDGDWENADLFIAQFNPVLRRDNPISENYAVEDISGNLKKALTKNRTKKLTLALDLTIEYLHSERVQTLLEEFQEEIAQGTLCIVCFRSGLKFDLFGMDNYAGAPCFVIHNQDPAWLPFQEILTDRALQTDHLSLQWFCLAFENTPDLLDLYRKQIFDNTRAVLTSLPDSFYEKKRPIRAIAAEKDVDLSFIDIKVSGPLHTERVSAVAGLSLYLHCMKEKQPIFLRRSFGFYHTNFGMLFTPDECTIRLTIGLDPSQVEGIAHCLEKL